MTTKAKQHKRELPADLLERLSRYIEENYEAPEPAEAVLYEQEAELSMPIEACRAESLEEVLDHLGESFQERLLRFIDERGLTDPEVYKAANIDRKLFSKIRCNKDYIPKKKTILALCIGLKLNLDDARDLLATAGLALSNSSRSDLIVMFCLENQHYDIYEVNALLDQLGEKTLN